MAAKLKDFSKTQFEDLCKIQCTKEEICDWFRTTDKTLENWVKRVYEGAGFSEVFQQKRGEGLISLRRIQFRMAKKHVVMAIFLGKQLLGQKDVSRSEITGKDGEPVKIERPLIDWSKFSVDQLDVIVKIMRQVDSDGNDRDADGKHNK